MLEGFKDISKHLTALLGYEFSANAAQKAVSRSSTGNPLPITWRGGRAFADKDRLRSWSVIEKTRRIVRSRSAA